MKNGLRKFRVKSFAGTTLSGWRWQRVVRWMRASSTCTATTESSHTSMKETFSKDPTFSTTRVRRPAHTKLNSLLRAAKRDCSPPALLVPRLHGLFLQHINAPVLMVSDAASVHTGHCDFFLFVFDVMTIKMAVARKSNCSQFITFQDIELKTTSSRFLTSVGKRNFHFS